MKRTTLLRLGLGIGLLAPTARAADVADVPFAPAGRIKPRHAGEIAASNWSVGAETMDRDYTVYAHWKSYLGPLGVKKARIQGGWAKTEKTKGVYDFAWLDEVVFDLPRQGVEPWLSLSYGNPIYEGGGDPQIKGRVPTSEIGLAAWAAWVRATVTRYKEVIDEWEVWNEPNYDIVPADYARLLVLTAETVKAVQPHATIVAFGLGSGVNFKYARSVLEILRAQGKVGLVDQISHHRHQANPDVRGPEIELEQVVAEFSDAITIRQGEAGCPSETGRKRAMANYPWTELIQSKHVLRRLLGDLGRDKESSVFGIVDMKYPDEMNRKGLLRARDDRTVERPKPAYFAVQHLTAVFDNRLVRTTHFRAEPDRELPLSAYAYRHGPSGQSVITLWLHDQIPSDDNRKTNVDLRLSGVNFRDPLFVDLRTGQVYEVPAGQWKREGDAVKFRRIPVYDSPILIADRATLPLQP